MARTYRMKLIRTKKQKDMQKYNHKVIRSIVRDNLSKVDIDIADDVDIFVPKYGVNPYDVLDVKIPIIYCKNTNTKTTGKLYRIDELFE